MRTTNRLAPPGYVYVDKTLAERLYNAGVPVTVHGNNTNSYHVFGGWRLGYTMNNPAGVSHSCSNEYQFTNRVSSFMFHLHRGLGYYPVFCVPVSRITENDVRSTR